MEFVLRKIINLIKKVMPKGKGTYRKPGRPSKAAKKAASKRRKKK